MLFRLSIIVLLIAGVAHAGEPSWQERQNIPDWGVSSLTSEAFSVKYVLSTRLNPFLVQGDFNGDSRVDLAVLVRRVGTGEAGIAIVHAGSDRPVVIGAGTSLGPGGTDYNWMNAWRVYSKGPVRQGADAQPPPELHGDALLVMALEASSAIIYWHQSEYRWYQQGD